jgi:hypothetical protein
MIRMANNQIELFKQTFHDLSGAFTKAIQTVQDEAPQGVGSVGKTLISKLEAMREEIDGWRRGEGMDEVKAQGGERTDSVEKTGGEGGGTYAD